MITDKIQENYNIYNIGNNTPVKLLDFIQAVEGACNKKAQLDFYPMQDGDIPETFADIEDLKAVTGYIPSKKLMKEYKNLSLV